MIGNLFFIGFNLVINISHSFMFAVLATHKKGVGEFHERAYTLGDQDKGDRVTLWICCCFLLHLPAMAVLGQSGYSCNPPGLCCCS